MSSSHNSNNRSFRSRGRGRSYQQRFVPKAPPLDASSVTTAPPTTITTTTSTTSVQQTSGSNYPRISASLQSPLHKRSTRTLTFLNYLPQDEAVASGLTTDSDALEAQAVVDILNEDLSYLLRLPPRDFWREVADNSTLPDALGSYLLFRNRWYDIPHRGLKGGVAGIVVGDGELSRRVFMAFYRMSSNRDPGSSARDGLSAKEHVALVQDKKLLDLPKLLDICAIYGRDNEDLTRKLVNNAIKAQPTLVEMLPNTCHQFLRIANTVHQRCNTLLEASSSADWADKGHIRLYEELLEVIDYINDSVVTLHAFVDAYKRAALYFSFPAKISNGNRELLSTLGGLHDSLLPSLLQVFILLSVRDKNHEPFPNGNTIESVELSLKLLSARVIKLGWILLEICYLNDEVFDDASLASCGKLFPSQISDPLIRGDILVQAFKDIGPQACDVPQKNQAWGTFLQAIDKNYYIVSRIDSLRSNGWLFMDDDQFRCLIQATTSSDFGDKVQKISVSSLSNMVEESNESDVILESKISQIRDIFPEYGRGFLAACLDVYDQNPEAVIQRILEGTLHEDLLALPTSLDQIAPSRMANSDVSGKGKGILVEPETVSKDKGKGILNAKLSQAAGWLSSAGPVGERYGDDPSFSSASGRFLRKSKNEQPDSEVLDLNDSKDFMKSTVLAAAEYEDEYDDSFDDLGWSVAESGTEEVDVSGNQSNSEVQNNGARWNSKRTPQFYVKDGKNYSYKISGSVAVSDAREAAAYAQSQKDLIHGLGRGGNVPYAGVPGLMCLDEELPEEQTPAPACARGRGNSNLRGRGGRSAGTDRAHGRMENIDSHSEKSSSLGEVNVDADCSQRGGRQPSHRGRGSGRGGNHHRKDRAMKKHFAGLTGY